jgi:hypothetical protein
MDERELVVFIVCQKWPKKHMHSKTVLLLKSLKGVKSSQYPLAAFWGVP